MNEPKQNIPFEPVPTRSRRDGWTVEKQYAFIEALAETGSRPRTRRPVAFAAFRTRKGRRHHEHSQTFGRQARARTHRSVNIGNFRPESLSRPAAYSVRRQIIEKGAQ